MGFFIGKNKMGIGRKLYHAKEVNSFKTIADYCKAINISRACYYSRKQGYSKKTQYGNGIYFLECDGFVKIGWTSRLSCRLVSLQIGSPHEQKLLLFAKCSSRSIEKQIQAQLASYHYRGEWYVNNSVVKRYLETIKQLSDGGALRPKDISDISI